MPAVSASPYNLNLFPNPINYGGITVTYDLPANSLVEFKITDCIGRILTTLPQKQETEGTHRQEVNVSNFAEGVYLFVAIINGQQKVIKFIKL